MAPEKWRGLFEYVVWRLLLLLEPGHAGCFLADLCDPRRFDGLPLQAVTAAGRGRMFGDGRAVPTTPYNSNTTTRKVPDATEVA